jgi:hypothetical protein
MSRSEGEGEREKEEDRERGKEPFAKKPGFRLVMPLKLAFCLPSISE